MATLRAIVLKSNQIKSNQIKSNQIKMKYLPTVNVWLPAISAALQHGQLKLQRGQWVTCGDGHSPARFVARKGNALWIAHSEGSKGTGDSFRRLCAVA